MKNLTIIAGISLCLTMLCLKTEAQPYKIAAGVRISNAAPTLTNCISGKFFVTNAHALETLVSFGTRFGAGLLLEIHQPMGSSGFSWFYGGGAFWGIENNKNYAGPTGIVGLDYKFKNVPLNLSLDLKPEMEVVPSVKIIPDAFGFSARFVF
jgi:hypothetical protein